MPKPIRSTKNPLVRRVRDVRAGEVPGLAVAEGLRLVTEALDARLEVVESLVAPRLYRSERGQELASRLARESRESADCSDEMLERASGLTTSQGVLAILRVPEPKEASLFAAAHAFVVAAAGVQDPGNLGALLRTAEAAGATGFVSLEGSADPWRDKALRGSAGSVFRLPTLGPLSADALVDVADRRGASLVAMDAAAEQAYWDADFGGAPQIFVVGSEGRGLPKVLRERSDCFVRIPMHSPVESLNVSVAAGLVLYEHRRRITERES